MGNVLKNVFLCKQWMYHFFYKAINTLVIIFLEVRKIVTNKLNGLIKFFFHFMLNKVYVSKNIFVLSLKVGKMNSE